MTNRIQYKPTKIKNNFNLCLDMDIFGSIFTNMNDGFTVKIGENLNEVFTNRVKALEYLESEFKIRYWNELYLEDNYKFFRPRFRWLE